MEAYKQEFIEFSAISLIERQKCLYSLYLLEI